MPTNRRVGETKSLRRPHPQLVRVVQPGNKFRPVPGGHTRSKVVPLSRKDTDVVSQQMQGDVLDGPGWAGGGLLPILFRQAREESPEFSESRSEEIDNDDRASRVQVTLSSASARILPVYRHDQPVGPTNRLLSVVRPRMTDKTSWTKPPSLHHYGDSRGGDRRAEAAFDPRGRPPPDGGGTRSSDSGGAAAAGERDARPSSAWGADGEPSVPEREQTGVWAAGAARSRGVQERDAQRARRRRGEDLGDAQPALRANGTARNVEPGQPEHERGHGFDRRLG